MFLQSTCHVHAARQGYMHVLIYGSGMCAMMNSIPIGPRRHMSGWVLGPSQRGGGGGGERGDERFGFVGGGSVREGVSGRSDQVHVREVQGGDGVQAQRWGARAGL